MINVVKCKQMYNKMSMMANSWAERKRIEMKLDCKEEGSSHWN